MPRIELESLESLPAPVHPLFTKDPSGKFVYDPEKIPETEGLRTNAAKLLAERQALAAQLTEYSALGKPAATLKSELEELEQLRSGKGKAWEQERQTLVDRHREELKVRDERLLKLESDWGSSQIAALTQAVVAPIAVDGAAEALAAMLRRGVTEDGRDFKQLDWRQDRAGQWGLVVLDSAGQPRTKGSVGEAFTLQDLANELREKNKAAQYLIKGSDGAGSGGRPGAGGEGNYAGVTKKTDLKTAKDKAGYINSRGLEAWNALPDA